MTTRTERGSTESLQTKILGTINDPRNLDRAGGLRPDARAELLKRIGEAGFSQNEVDSARTLAEQTKGTQHGAIIETIAAEVLGGYHDQGRIRRAIADLRDPPRAAKPSKEWVNHLPPLPSAETVKGWVDQIHGNQNQLQRTVNRGELHHGFHAATVFAELSELTLYANAAIPDDARVGWMAKNADDPAKPAKHLGVARGSNGQGCPFLSHKAPDVRGLAFLSDAASITATNQTRGQHVKSAEEFVSFAEANTDATSKGYTGLLGTAANAVEVLQQFGLVDGGKVLARLGRDTTFPPDSLATSTFVGSITRLGDYAVKVVFIPDPKAEGGTKVEGRNPKGHEAYLSEDAANRGSKKYICCLQFYTNAADTPLDDATKAWKSPLIPVGEMVTKPIADRDVQRKVARLIELTRINPANIDVGPAPAGKTDLERPLIDVMSAPRKEIYDGSADHRAALSHEGSLELVRLLHKVEGKSASAGETARFNTLLGVVDRMDAVVAQRETGKLTDEAAWEQIKALRLEVAAQLTRRA